MNFMKIKENLSHGYLIFGEPRSIGYLLDIQGLSLLSFETSIPSPNNKTIDRNAKPTMASHFSPSIKLLCSMYY
jgi:hypothetical protein